MKKFLVIYHAPMSNVEQTSVASPENMQKVMQPWMDWIAKCGDSLVDLGAPLGGGQNLSGAANTPSNRDVTGYSILQAEDIEAPIGLLKGRPHLEMTTGGEIEVHELMPMPMWSQHFMDVSATGIQMLVCVVAGQLAQ
jgi:hypothetical protein